MPFITPLSFARRDAKLRSKCMSHDCDYDDDVLSSQISRELTASADELEVTAAMAKFSLEKSVSCSFAKRV